MNRVLSTLTNRLGSILCGAYFIWGIIFGGWSPIFVLIGYWIEELLTGIGTFAALVALRIARGEKMFIGRFSFVYGFAFFVHTVFVLILTGIFSSKDAAAEQVFDLFFDLVRGSGPRLSGEFSSRLAVIFAVVLVGVTYSIVRLLVRGGAWRTLHPSSVINRSFKAIILPHFILVFGIGGIIVTNAPSALTAVLVAVKVLLEMTGFADRGSPIVGTDER